MTNDNLFLLVTAELAQETLDAILFPIKLSIPESIESEDYILGEAEVEIVETLRTDRDYESSESASDFKGYINENAVLLRDGLTHVDDEDVEIFNAYKVDVPDSSSVESKSTILGRLKKALLLPIKKTISIELVWVKMEIDKPGFTLGDPILIEDMVVRIQVKFRAGMKISGKGLLKTFTTELITLQARQLKLVLQTKGAKVNVLPSFTDVDVVLKFSMLGLTFTTKPGITSIINKQLHKQGPMEIMDLSSFEKQIPFSRSKLGVDSVAFAQDPKGLIINMVMSVI